MPLHPVNACLRTPPPNRTRGRGGNRYARLAAGVKNSRKQKGKRKMRGNSRRGKWPRRPQISRLQPIPWPVRIAYSSPAQARQTFWPACILMRDSITPSPQRPHTSVAKIRA